MAESHEQQFIGIEMGTVRLLAVAPNNEQEYSAFMRILDYDPDQIELVFGCPESSDAHPGIDPVDIVPFCMRQIAS